MTRTPLSTTLDGYEVWFVTGSQNLYGEETLRQVAEQSQAVADGLDGLPVKVVWKPVLKDSDSIRRLALEVNARDDVIGVIAWMHTFSPAKMWIAGLDALQKPLLHLHTQANVELPWADIDFDFMNLNQAAHGDREFGYIQTRLGVARKTVVGHVSNPVVRQQVEDWQRAAAGWTASRTLKLARFGDNMRYVAVTEGDKTEAELRFGVQVNTWGVNELADAVAAASDADIDALVAEYVELYDVADELLPGGDAPPVAARRRGDRARPALVPRGGRLRRVHDELRRPRRAQAAAGPRGAAAHGRGLRLRRRGRLEDRDPGARRERDGRGPARRREPDGGLHLRPRARQRAHPRRAHARGLAVADDQQAPARGARARHRRQGRPGAPRLHRRPRPRARRRDERHARPVPPGRERRRERRGARPAEASRSAARSGSPSPTSPRAPDAGWPQAPPTTPS